MTVNASRNFDWLVCITLGLLTVISVINGYTIYGCGLIQGLTWTFLLVFLIPLMGGNALALVLCCVGAVALAVRMGSVYDRFRKHVYSIALLVAAATFFLGLGWAHLAGHAPVCRIST